MSHLCKFAHVAVAACAAAFLFTYAPEAACEQSVSMSAKVDSDVAQPRATSRQTDHDMFDGSFAVGYLGVRGVPIAVNPVVTEDGGTHLISMKADTGTANAPLVGLRYWVSDSWGVDFGLGFATSSTSVTQSVALRDTKDPFARPQDVTTSYNPLAQTGFLVHAGVPLALSTTRHFVFEVIPEVNLGFSTGTVQDSTPNLPPDKFGVRRRNEIKVSGFSLDIGARVGSEIHFGFIGVPNLALQATIGLGFAMNRIKADGGMRQANDSNITLEDAQPRTSYKASDWSITTSVSDAPWAIFQNTISALYYF